MSLDIRPAASFRMRAFAAADSATGLWLALAAITLLSALWQQRWGTIPDTSWLITAGERLLGGERLYVDLYETNPPFSVWLYLPPVVLAAVLGIAPEPLVHAWTTAAALGGLVLAGWIARQAGLDAAGRLTRLSPFAFAALMLFPGNAFSEREHIGLALFLPFLALKAWRLDDRPGHRPGLGVSLGAGLMGAVLILVKPHYALLVLAPAGLVAWRRRSLAPLFAVEHWVIGVVAAAYMAAVVALHPEFLQRVYPVLVDLYGPITAYRPIVQLYGPACIAIGFLAWRLWPPGQCPPLPATVGVTALAALVPLLLQGKGWPYHALPALLLGVMTLLCLLALPPGDRRSWKGREALRSLMAPTGLVAGLAVLVAAFPYLPTQKPGADLVEAVRRDGGSPAVAVIGSDIAVGHPFTRMVDGRWVSAYVSDWLGAFAFYLSARAALSGDLGEAARYEAIGVGYADAKMADLTAHPPDILLVQRADRFWIETLRRRFALDTLLARYALIAEDETVGIYRRSAE